MAPQAQKLEPRGAKGADLAPPPKPYWTAQRSNGEVANAIP
jgi:hypothetical protein